MVLPDHIQDIGCIRHGKKREDNIREKRRKG